LQISKAKEIEKANTSFLLYSDEHQRIDKSPALLDPTTNIGNDRVRGTGIKKEVMIDYHFSHYSPIIANVKVNLLEISEK